MTFKEYGSYDAVGLATLVRTRQVSASELLDEAIERTTKVDPQLNAVVVKHHGYARRQIDKGLPDGPFTGVPFLLKDLEFLEGTRTTSGASIHKDDIAAHTGTLARRFLDAGLTIFGKSSTPEFGLLPTTESRLFGPTRNPWNPEHSSGGSSGGAGAAVAARIVPVAHASDGGGSIRIPASASGVFGLKPTRARNPIGPERGEGWSGFSCGHVLSISVRDSAAMLDATHGPEPTSPYVAPAPPRLRRRHAK
jgi:amidase